MSYIKKITDKNDKKKYDEYFNKIIEFDAQIRKIKKQQNDLLKKIYAIDRKYK